MNCRENGGGGGGGGSLYKNYLKYNKMSIIFQPMKEGDIARNSKNTGDRRELVKTFEKMEINTLYTYLQEIEGILFEKLKTKYDEETPPFKEIPLTGETIENTNISMEEIFDEDFLLDLDNEVYTQIEEYEIKDVFYITPSLKNKITNTILENILYSLELMAEGGEGEDEDNEEEDKNDDTVDENEETGGDDEETGTEEKHARKYDLEFLKVEELTTFIKERVDIYFEFTYSAPSQVIPRSIRIDVFDKEHLPDVLERDELEQLDERMFLSKTIQSKIEYLKNQYQPPQQTDEWYNLRNQIMTASNIYKILGTQSQYNSFICEKCTPVVKKETTYVNTNDARHWGHKYEKLTLLIYQTMYQAEVGEFGCIKHSQYDYIGASPDGIVVGDDILHPHYGRMIEIKNIVNREITGDPLEAYWVQMQIQMEVCDLDLCNFIETRFKECETIEEWKRMNKKKGVVISNIPISFTNEYIAPEYEFVIYDENNCMEEFIEKWMSKHTVVNWWYMMEFSCVVVPRNRAWFASVLPRLTEAWNTILLERENGEYKKRFPKKKMPVNKCLIHILLEENHEEENEKEKQEENQLEKKDETIKRFCIENNMMELDKNTVVIKDSFL